MWQPAPSGPMSERQGRSGRACTKQAPSRAAGWRRRGRVHLAASVLDQPLLQQGGGGGFDQLGEPMVGHADVAPPSATARALG